MEGVDPVDGVVAPPAPQEPPAQPSDTAPAPEPAPTPAPQRQASPLAPRELAAAVLRQASVRLDPAAPERALLEAQVALFEQQLTTLEGLLQMQLRLANELGLVAALPDGVPAARAALIDVGAAPDAQPDAAAAAAILPDVFSIACAEELLMDREHLRALAWQAHSQPETVRKELRALQKAAADRLATAAKRAKHTLSRASPQPLLLQPSLPGPQPGPRGFGPSGTPLYGTASAPLPYGRPGVPAPGFGYGYAPPHGPYGGSMELAMPLPGTAAAVKAPGGVDVPPQLLAVADEDEAPRRWDARYTSCIVLLYFCRLGLEV
jgi:hypothetical protein